MVGARILLFVLVTVSSLLQFGGQGAVQARIAPPELLTFRIDPSSSKFIVHAHRGGLAWFKGHDHYFAVRQFSGEASLTLDVLNPAELSMIIQSNSLEETGADFT